MPSEGVKVEVPGSKISVHVHQAVDGAESFYIRFRNGRPTPDFESFGTLEQAVNRVHEIEYHRKIRRKPAEERGKLVTLGDFIASDDYWGYQQRRRKPGYVDSLKGVLPKWIGPRQDADGEELSFPAHNGRLADWPGNYPLNEFTTEVAEWWVDWMLDEGAGKPTVNRMLGISEGIFTRALKTRYLDPTRFVNPISYVERLPYKPSNQSPFAASLEDVFKIKQQIKGEGNSELVSALCFLGLRQQDAYPLSWDYLIDKDGKPRSHLAIEFVVSGGEIVAGAKTPAGVRQPEIWPFVQQEFLAYYQRLKRPARKRLVWPNEDGGLLDRRNWLKRTWNKTLEAAGYEKDSRDWWTPHDGRDVCVTMLSYAHYSLREIQEYIGHSSIEVTSDSYLKTWEKAKRSRAVPVQKQLENAAKRAKFVIPT